MFNSVFLTKQGGFLGPIAWVLGEILNAIYNFVALFGIENIALCIILFTLIVKMLMLPLTIKQQKYSKLSAKMNPEITAITNKYKGKKDEESQRRQQLEMQAVYEKYGSSPVGGCLPMLISLPIMFALYRVIYAIPAYIDKVKGLYENVAVKIREIEGYAASLKTFVDENAIAVTMKNFKELEENVLTSDHIIDILACFDLQNWTALQELFPTIAPTIAENAEQITHVNSFLGNLNILNTPMANGLFSLGIIVPILAMVFQILQTKQMSGNTQMDPDNPTAQSMKAMNTFMPIMSGFICLMIPIGVGIYWIASSVFQIVQQIFINRYLENTDLDEMIAKNVEKQAKRREKYGIETGNKMAEIAKTSTKSIDAKPRTMADYANLSGKDYTSEAKSGTTGSSSGKGATGGSIASYANIMKNRTNEK